MKFHFAVVVSLAANVALAVILLSSKRSLNVPNAVSSAPRVVTKNFQSTPAFAGANPNSAFAWTSIGSADHRQYIANLRAVDCPEWLVRDIIVADIDDLYRSKSKTDPLVFVPWQSTRTRVQAARNQSVKLETLNREKRACVKSLLGYEWSDCAEQTWNLDLLTSFTLGGLPEEKLPRVLSLKNQYADAAQKIREEANFILIDEDRTKLDLLFKDFQTELSRQLGVSELDEFQLRAQQGFLAAHNLHFEGVVISPGELREIVRLSTSVKSMTRDEFSADGPLSADEREQRQAIFQAQVRSLLGAERFADYQRAQDSNFQEIYDFVQQKNLPKSAAISVFESCGFADTQTDEIQKDASLTPEERAMALNILKTTVAGKISAALGGSFQTYLAGPGQWLANPTASPVQTP